MNKDIKSMAEGIRDILAALLKSLPFWGEVEEWGEADILSYIDMLKQAAQAYFVLKGKQGEGKR